MTDTTDETQPSRVEIADKKRVFDGFFKIDEVQVRHELFGPAGKMSQPQPMLVFERGDAVAALLYDPSSKDVRFVEQFRLPVHGKNPRNGWIEEAVAAIKAPGESEFECLKRCVAAKTGYEVVNAFHVATYFSSPGGSSERIFLYVVETGQRRAGRGIGAGVGEDFVRLRSMDRSEFFSDLDRGMFQDPKLLLAGQYLRDKLSKSQQRNDDAATLYVVGPIDETTTQGFVIGILPGDMLAWKGVEVWVNSETTDLEMDRFFGNSVSSMIRREGAECFDGSERIKRDTIAEALDRERGRKDYVGLGKVFRTTSGRLKEKNEVQEIVHVTATTGRIGQIEGAGPEFFETCMNTILDEIDGSGFGSIRSTRHKSVLIPLIGTGEGGLLASEVAPKLVKCAIEYFERKRKRPDDKGLREIYFSAYSQSSEVEFKRALEYYVDADPARLTRIEDGIEGEDSRATVLKPSKIQVRVVRGR